jgi:hypothetical protein
MNRLGRFSLFLLTFALAVPLVAAEPPENANNRHHGGRFAVLAAKL